jgi:hypothetical protein
MAAMAVSPQSAEGSLCSIGCPGRVYGCSCPSSDDRPPNPYFFFFRLPQSAKRRLRAFARPLPDGWDASGQRAEKFYGKLKTKLASRELVVAQTTAAIRAPEGPLHTPLEEAVISAPHDVHAPQKAL